MFIIKTSEPEGAKVNEPDTVVDLLEAELGSAPFPLNRLAEEPLSND